MKLAQSYPMTSLAKDSRPTLIEYNAATDRGLFQSDLAWDTSRINCVKNTLDLKKNEYIHRRIRLLRHTGEFYFTAITLMLWKWEWCPI